MRIHQNLFDHMSEQYGLTLLEDEMECIIVASKQDNWQTFEEYDNGQKCRPCWITYKGRVEKAHVDFDGVYWRSDSQRGSNFPKKYITHCMDEIVPQPPID